MVQDALPNFFALREEKERTEHDMPANDESQ